MHDTSSLHFLLAPGYAGSSAERIAYQLVEGAGPTLIWCGGLKSDMEGGKATYLHRWAEARKQAFIRFDYYGHGQSTGDFQKGGLSRWSRDIIHIIDALTKGPVILIGSSMGGWASLLTTQQRPDRVKALILIAPAPDFTQALMWDHFPADIRKQIMEDGVYFEPSDYGEPMPISRTLIEDGRKNLILNAPIPFEGPVRILQGQLDRSVPWDHAQRLMDKLTSQDVEMTLVKSGDHSLSSPPDLIRLERICARLSAQVLDAQVLNAQVLSTL